MNKKLNKNSIYLKYKFCNNIHYRSKAWSVSKKIFFLEIYIYSERICSIDRNCDSQNDIVRKYLYFE